MSNRRQKLASLTHINAIGFATGLILLAFAYFAIPLANVVLSRTRVSDDTIAEAWTRCHSHYAGRRFYHGVRNRELKGE